MFLMGNVRAYLSQSVYFIRAVQGKDSGKNQALTILDTTHQFRNHQGTQNTLSKVLINLASESLLTVLVLYLILHQGAGMWTQQVVFFKEM
jgi:hypothetical protein